MVDEENDAGQTEEEKEEVTDEDSEAEVKE